MPIPIHVENFPEKEKMHSALYDLLCKEWQTNGYRPGAVLLSGGNTPLPVYNRIADRPFPVSDRAYLALADERHVTEDSPDSNYGNMAPMINALNFPEAHVLRVHTDLSLDQAADRYDLELNSFLENKGYISLALLGLGEDGHTCSIFPDTDLSAFGNRMAVPIRKASPPDRISVTPRLLEKADRILFVVSGAGKEIITQQLLEKPEETVAGRVTANCSRVELWRV